MKVGRYEINLFRAYGGGLSWPFDIQKLDMTKENLVYGHILWLGFTIWINDQC